MTNSIFADLIEIARGNTAVADARIKELSDFSDEQHAVALSRRMGLRLTTAKSHTIGLRVLRPLWLMVNRRQG